MQLSEVETLFWMVHNAAFLPCNDFSLYEQRRLHDDDHDNDDDDDSALNNQNFSAFITRSCILKT